MHPRIALWIKPETVREQFQTFERGALQTAGDGTEREEPADGTPHQTQNRLRWAWGRSRGESSDKLAFAAEKGGRGELLPPRMRPDTNVSPQRF